MNPELKVIIYEQRKLFKKMLDLLDEQYDLILEKDATLLDRVARNLESTSREVAKLEIKRRNIVEENTSMSSLVDMCNDENIKEAFEEIKSTLKMIEIQKDSNNTLLKQKLLFTKKMLNMINPRQGVGTYNYCGQVGK